MPQALRLPQATCRVPVPVRLASAPYSIYPSGVVTFPGGSIGGFRGVMTKDKSMIVGTISPAAGDYSLVVMFKEGGTYSPADLPGTWALSQLSAGASPTWTHGASTIKTFGIMSTAAIITSSGTGSIPKATLTIDATGSVTSDRSATFSGVLSQDKNLMAAVATNPDGTYGLMTLTRTDGTTTFDGSDLKGIWRTNWLSAGNGSSASYYGRALFASDGLEIDADGDIAAAMTSIQLSSFSQADFPLTAAFGPTGLITFNNTSFYGTMSMGKNLMIGTWSEANGNPSLYLFAK